MHVLVIGGNRFMGVSLVWRLLFAGHRVTVCNRGNLADPFGDRVERVRADRSTGAFDAALAGRAFDRVIDMAGFTGDDVARALRVLGDRVGHYLFVSTGQVYLVREGCPRPAREDDYAGPVMAAPPTPADEEDWAYGVGKRAAEDALAAAAVPSTRVRIPMANGERDPKRRLESYLWRMLDGGPLLVPGADAIARHVYRGAVVDALARMVDAPPPGAVYNLAQTEQPTVRELLMQHLSAPLPEVGPEVPAALARVVRRALAKHPDDRPASATALERELAEATRPGWLDGLRKWIPRRPADGG